MKHSAIIIISLLFSNLVSAQLSDRLWLGGYNEFPGNPGNGQFQLWFSETGPIVSQQTLAFNFESTVAAATSPGGEILFYSNGCEIANRLHQVMPNGSGLNPGELSDQICPWKGYLVPQGAMVLPMPGDSSQFYLIHMGAAYEPQRKLKLGPLYYSVVDMTLDNGRGDVVSKNIVVLNGDLTSFTAIRHGNGRDWWLLAPEFNNVIWHIFLISPQGIQEFPTQMPAMGGYRCDHHGQIAVSLDGSRMAIWGDCKMTLFDFNRCDGEIGPSFEMAIPAHWFAGGGVAFSPSGKYLYATDHNVLLRADLEASFPKLDTMRFSYGFGNYTVPGNTFHNLINGPNGIIYGNIPSRASYFHALKNPDGTGIDDINFVPQAVPLPVTNVRTLPHFPNFRLFDLEGSHCDTLGIDGPIVSTLTPSCSTAILLSPNPTSDHCQIRFSPAANGFITILNLQGRVILNGTLENTRVYDFDTKSLPSGLYIVRVSDASNFVLTGKLVVSR